jgi:hypothetical protein
MESLRRCKRTCGRHHLTIVGTMGPTIWPEPGDWQPYQLEAHPEAHRPTLAALNTFLSALYGGELPRESWRSTGPDYDLGQIVITIYPDDQPFRKAVATTLPAEAYRIVVEDAEHFGC